MTKRDSPLSLPLAFVLLALITLVFITGLTLAGYTGLAWAAGAIGLLSMTGLAVSAGAVQYQREHKTVYHNQSTKAPVTSLSPTETAAPAPTIRHGDWIEGNYRDVTPKPARLTHAKHSTG